MGRATPLRLAGMSALAVALVAGAGVGGAGAVGADAGSQLAGVVLVARDSTLVRPRMGLAPGFRQPMVMEITVEPSVSQRPFEPLSPEQLARLRQARSLRESGLLDRSRGLLEALATERPHHPQILTERARLEIAAHDYAAVERLARPERAARRDSLLMASELILALERLARVREAAEVALEAWSADPAQAWAGDSLGRLFTADPKAVRELLRAAARRLPGRADLVLASCRMEWRAGDPRETLRMLAAADGPARRPPLRERFADELLSSGAPRDSGGAVEALLDEASDARLDLAFRLIAAKRAWELAVARNAATEVAPRLTRSLADCPPERWDPELLMDVARALRRAGLTAESRTLLAVGERNLPKRDLELEQALADLRDGPPDRALPRLQAAAPGSAEAAFRFAEALFFAGLPDSALAWYQHVTLEPASEFAGPALERIYLIEDAQPRAALPAFGRIAWEEWRGEQRGAAALTDSLYHALPRGPLWAQAGLKLAEQREAAGDDHAALEPLLAVADSLPGDRLAPLARQRAGDLYLLRLKDAPRALAQYEECLARYPRAWNAPEVRRKLEQLRRERRL